MKPVIILGKGPSARFLDKSDKYDVATINNSIWMHSEPKWSFFNDLESMEQMKDSDFDKVSTIITPSYLHSQYNPRFNNQSCDFHFYRLAEFFPERFNNIDFIVTVPSCVPSIPSYFVLN